MLQPFISIIIINFNGKKWLSKCFDSLKNQSYKKFEVVFVDNASTDGSIDFVAKNYKFAKIVRNKKNYGFAKANNIGLKHARGSYLFLLNNDTFIDKDCLKNLIEGVSQLPKDVIIQPKILRMDDIKRLDQCGAYWTDSTYLYHYGYGKNASIAKYNKPQVFFSAMGAALLIKKNIIRKIGLFDDAFWSYYEETDFCHRAWIAGYQCWYYPFSRVYHAKGGTSSQFDYSYITYHNFKNKLRSFIKNFQVQSLIAILPIFIMSLFLLSIVALFKNGVQSFLAFYKGLFWNILNLNTTLRLRKKIQKMRKKYDSEILNVVRKNPKLSYYFYLFKGLEYYRDE